MRGWASGSVAGSEEALSKLGSLVFVEGRGGRSEPVASTLGSQATVDGREYGEKVTFLELYNSSDCSDVSPC